MYYLTSIESFDLIHPNRYPHWQGYTTEGFVVYLALERGMVALGVGNTIERAVRSRKPIGNFNPTSDVNLTNVLKEIPNYSRIL